MLARLSIAVPTRGKFTSPFRADSKPSCEILGSKIRDWTTGQNFDAIACYAEAKGLSNSDAISALAAELPGRAPKPPAQEKRDLVIPTLRWNHDEAGTLATLRGIGIEGIHMAGAILGTLGFAEISGFPCWILADGSRKIAEARRMDGQPFPAAGTLGERKSHTLRGSCKSWPLGTAPTRVTVPDKSPVVLVEGSPDYLAAADVAFHAEREFLPVSMLGAGQSIHTAALGFFTGRDVLILGHPDQAGLDSAKRWARQLGEAGAKVSARQLDGGDLNDLVKLHGAKAVATMLSL